MTTQLKTIRVRPGQTGFYTRILHEGEVAQIPADIPATKNGWFDDVEDEAPSTIAAHHVGQSEENTDESYHAPVIHDQSNPSLVDHGAFSNGVYDASAPLSDSDGQVESTGTNLQDAPENTQEPIKGTGESVDHEGGEADAKPDSKKTIADIIEEIESFGVVEFDRSQKRAELLELLLTIRKANQ